MTERTLDPKSSRREILKLGGAAALGAAGLAALSTKRVKAAGSGNTIVPYLNPVHIASGHLNANQEVVIGPFPYPPPNGGGFGSDSYMGMIGNLTASGWKGHGWMSVRSTDYAFDPVNQAQNLHFGGNLRALSNAFATVFGFSGTASGMVSTGQFVLHNGPAAADYVVDLLSFLVDDSDF